MFGGSSTRVLACSIAAGAALVSGLAACSGGSDDDAAEPERPCAVVPTDDLSDVLGTDVRLQAAEEGSLVCTYLDADRTYEVQVAVEGPVEEGLPELLLTEPEEVDDLGDEAWLATREVPLDLRLLVREGGTLLTVDLEALKRPDRERRALIVEIAEAGMEQLPEQAAKEPQGARGDEACERFDVEEAAVAMGGLPVVDAVLPPGSCRLSVAAENLTVTVSVLLETGAGPDQLDALVAAIDSRTEVTVGEAPAYWLTTPGGTGVGGQLDVLDDERILQVAVVAEGLADDEAQALAVAIAELAIAD